MIVLSRGNCSMNLRLDEISKAVGGGLEGPGNIGASGYSIDTRTIKAGDLFFAIKGPRFDGHDFLQQAVEKGASGVVVEAGNFGSVFALLAKGEVAEGRGGQGLVHA